LSLCFAGLSLIDDHLRSLCYDILRNFLHCLHNETPTQQHEQKLFDRRHFKCVIQLMKNSITSANQRINCVVTHFFARVCKLLLHPDDPVYSTITSFLLVKPTIDVENVPEFFKLFLSTSTEHHERERHWILTLLADGLRTPYEFAICEKRDVFNHILCLIDTPFADSRARSLALRCIKAAAIHPTVSVHLCNSYNLPSWLLIFIQSTSITRWELGFAADISTIIVSNLFVPVFGCDDDINRNAAPKTLMHVVCTMLIACLQRVKDVQCEQWLDIAKENEHKLGTIGDGEK